MQVRCKNYEDSVSVIPRSSGAKKLQRLRGKHGLPSPAINKKRSLAVLFLAAYTVQQVYHGIVYVATTRASVQNRHFTDSYFKQLAEVFI